MSSQIPYAFPSLFIGYIKFKLGTQTFYAEGENKHIYTQRSYYITYIFFIFEWILILLYFHAKV